MLALAGSPLGLTVTSRQTAGAACAGQVGRMLRGRRADPEVLQRGRGIPRSSPSSQGRCRLGRPRCWCDVARSSRRPPRPRRWPRDRLSAKQLLAELKIVNGAFGAVTLDAELGRAPAGMEVVPRADRVVLDEIRRNDLGHRPWQSLAIRTPISSLGVRGDFHPYANVVAVRIVQSEGGMSGSCARVSYEALSDVSSRPSETIEWE